jgi:glucosamine--fructose-6-phosphate aminotransferase (isomerizing)
MCGIVGYMEKRMHPMYSSADSKNWNTEDMTLPELQSAKTTLFQSRISGRLSVLESYLQSNPVEGCCGIGHTRWATHGAPSDKTRIHTAVTMA